ncbi:ISAs1 family transposase [Methylomagnum sp.]
MLPDPRPYFADLEDPRRETRNKLHKLSDILMIVFCAALAGAEDWVGMEDFALEEEAWFRGFLEPPNGVPSHDTLGKVFGRLKPEPFAEAFLRWAQAALPSLSGEQVCLDGKTLRGSRSEEGAVHLVSAYANQARMVLAQQAAADKSNEIMAIPSLLSLLDLRGATVTIDAMGCQRAIARQIVEAGGDYVLALKDNHPTLCAGVEPWLDTESGQGRLPPHETIERDHGRVEVRRHHLSDGIDWLEPRAEWAGLRAVGRVESIRMLGGRTTTECRYFLCSHTGLLRFAGEVRGHWGIENGQHWVLDVRFGEDANRARKDHSAKNLAPARRMALNLLRHNDPTSRQSLRRRKRRALLNRDCRHGLLFGDQQVPAS